MVEMIKNVFKNLFHKPATLRYPYEKRPAVPDYRGRFELIPTECIMCTLCEKGCPADAIKIDKENKHYELDPLKCIACGYCMERCPKDCIELKWEYTEPMTSREAGMDDQPQPAQGGRALSEGLQGPGIRKEDEVYADSQRRGPENPPGALLGQAEAYRSLGDLHQMP